MNAAKVTETVQHVLSDIQSKQGLKCPPLTNATKPLRDLERFDSPMSLAATGKIGRKLGISIPPGTNVFGDGKGLYTLEKTISVLCALSDVKRKEKADS